MLDPNGMEEDAAENDRAEDVTTDEASVCDNKHNSEDEEESGRPYSLRVTIPFSYISCGRHEVQ